MAGARNHVVVRERFGTTDRGGTTLAYHSSTDESIVVLRRIVLSLIALLGVSAMPGCGDSDEDLEVAEQSVRAGLDAWKRGEQPDSLKQLAPPIEFHDDDWQLGARLVDFQLETTYRDSAGTPRCAVQLTVEVEGQAEEKKVVYEAKVDGTVVVARDPYS